MTNIQPTLHFKRTRIAPTPSGYLHLGNILSFAITAALAKRYGAKILLRIDDLDRERVQSHFVQDIFDTLNFLEIHWDEGPRDFAAYEQEWSQLRRMDMYREALRQLEDEKIVFACNCTRAQIKKSATDDSYPGTCCDKNLLLDTPDVNWRLKTDSRFIKINTLAAPVTTVLPPDMRYFIVKKKDGYPAYQLTSVLDDVHFDVDLVVRGADLWASTLAQQYLAPLIGAADFNNCTFYHHTLLTNNGVEKLSKSAGDTSVNYLRKDGKTPAQIYQLIAGMAGIEAPVANWQQLAKAYFENKVY